MYSATSSGVAMNKHASRNTAMKAPPPRVPGKVRKTPNAAETDRRADRSEVDRELRGPAGGQVRSQFNDSINLPRSQLVPRLRLPHRQRVRRALSAHAVVGQDLLGRATIAARGNTSASPPF